MAECFIEKRNLYKVTNPLSGELSYAKIGAKYYSDVLYERGYNILELVDSGHLESVPITFPFEQEIVGKNQHSVISICPNCKTQGIYFPLDKNCDNCGYNRMVTYYDAETIHNFLTDKT